MNAEKFKELVDSLDVGKKLPDSIYFHKDTFSDVPEPLSKFIKIVAKALKIDDDNWNIIKVFRKGFRLSLLNYPFFKSPVSINEIGVFPLKKELLFSIFIKP